MKEIKRDAYLNEIIRKKNNGLVKVITGIRRCGKSYLLFTMYFNYLIQNGVDKNHIILFSFDNDEDIDKLDIYYPEEPTRIYDRTKKNYTINAKKFRAYIREITNEHDMFYIFLDEVQLLDNFVGTLNGFIRHVNFDTYVTGSNSRMLSKDVITEFRGRGDPIRIHPLSFKEFFDAVNKEFDEAYNEYSFYGGMPYIVHLLTEQDKSNYLKLLFEEVYKKDIVDRYSIVDANSFDSLVKILASSIGSYTNPSKLERTYKSNSISYSHNTIKKHIEYLMDSFLIDEVTKYDVKGKRYIGTSLKYYFKDIGLRNALLNFRQQEPTHIMENIIYNELRYRGYKVDVGVV
ncbi:MAG: ATP-binding protein, partial [Holdemanella sp.]|nr:ATP-binding protein [Holdemanella sp.]